MVLPNKFILIEGIDGGGKTQFVNFLEKEIKKKYNKSKHKTLSIFGQPSYSIENNNYIYNMIEFGKVSGNIKCDINRFKRNRVNHEKIINSNYKGLKICVRGVLTDIGTLYSRYNILVKSNLGQETKIELLVIIDTPIIKALQRIKKRKQKQWRENYKYLAKFKYVYSNKSYILKFLKPKKILIIKNTKDLKYLQFQAKKLVNGYIK